MERQIPVEMLEGIRQIISEIARMYGISEAEVRKEMQDAIREGMANPDPSVQAQWQDTPWQGVEPGAEEFIAWASLKSVKI